MEPSMQSESSVESGAVVVPVESAAPAAAVAPVASEEASAVAPAASAPETPGASVTSASAVPDPLAPPFDVVCEEFAFPSCDGKVQIGAYLWRPADEAAHAPRAIFQIAHGMAEFAQRYDHLARYLVGQGFIVVANDHIGHGKSVVKQDDWGCMPMKDGCRILVEDCHNLRTIAQSRYPGLPYIFYGHSMGSFVARAYLAFHAEGLAGAIICGTGHNPVAVCKTGGHIARRAAKFRGATYYSNFLNGLADGAYSKAIPDARTPLDWLSTDPAVVDAYIADPRTGFPFKVSGYCTLMDLTQFVAQTRNIACIPKSLPVYFIAGSDDPVGNMGKGVKAVFSMFQRAGIEDVRLKIYPGMRHEIHNEPGKAEVYGDILAWADEALAGSAGNVPAPAACGPEPAPEPEPAPAACAPAAAPEAAAARLVPGERGIVALDQGTTSSRSFLINVRGETVGMSREGFAQIYPQPGWVEHDANEIWRVQSATLAQLAAEHGLTAENVAAIGITNQRETTVVWDRETGEPIANAIVWQCRRTAALVEEVCGAPEVAARITELTGLAPDAYFSASKIRWILDHTPGAWDAARAGRLAFGTIDSWLIYKLTGGAVHATDYTNASRTMLFDIHACRWDEWLLGLWGIPASMMPEARPSAGSFGTVAQGPLAGVPIAGVVGDQQAALFGQCCFEAGQAKATYGTGCFLLMHTGNAPVVSQHSLVTTIAASAPGAASPEYALEGSVYTCAALIQWVQDALGIVKEAWETEPLAQTVPDNGGVYIVPALTGLGAPYWDADARGAILGITRGVQAGHLARATLEAVAYQAYDLVRAMEADLGRRIGVLNVDGGVSANNLCMQFQSDILKTAVRRPQNTETTSLGAAFLAGLAVGFWSGIDELRGLRTTDDVFEPSMGEGERERLIAGWKQAVARVLTK